jgi:hypothetical protein
MARRKSYTGRVSGIVADNAVIERFIQPKGRDIEFLALNAAIGTKSLTASNIVQLVDETNSDAIFATVAITGATATAKGAPTEAQAGSATFPFRVKGTTANRVWALKMDKASSSLADLNVEVICSDPGSVLE